MAQSSDIQAIWPDGTPRPLMPYSPAVRAGEWLFVAGHLASDYVHGLPPEVTAGNPWLRNRLADESAYLLENIAKTVEAAAGDIGDNAVRIFQWFVTNPELTDAQLAAGDTFAGISITPYLEARNAHIAEPRPASTGMGIAELLVKDTTIEVDLICRLDSAVSKGVPVPPEVPEPLAGYSPAIVRGDYVFLAGDTGTDFRGDFGRAERYGPDSALATEARVNPHIWYDSPIEAETEYTLWKLSRIAEAAGSSLERAIKADVYLAHPSDFAGFDRVWRGWFPKNPPARFVAPGFGFGPAGARVEIALQLLTNDSELTIETIDTPAAPRPLGHEPQAVRCGDLLYFSTQMAFDSSGGLAEGTERNPVFPYYGSPAKEQVRYILKNVAAICEAAGTDVENIVRRLCFHDDFAYFQEAIDEWALHFPGVKPASSTIRLAHTGMVTPGAKLVMDLIAYVPQL